MRKLLISILVILLLILTCFVIFKDITIAGWSNKNLDSIKKLNKNLDDKINVAKQLSNQEYPESISKLDNSIKELKKAKEKYESKKEFLSEEEGMGMLEVKEYDVERLWIAMGNYAKRENVEIKLDILETNSKDVYDLNITLVGEYIAITDFIYDIEKDDTLGFKILNFKLEPNSTIKTTTTNVEDNKQNEKTEETQKNEDKNSQEETKTEQITAVVDANTLKATFKIENVGIKFN